MNSYANKTKKNKSQLISNTIPQKKSDSKQTFHFVDNRPETVTQRKLNEMVNNSPQANQTAQLQAIANNYSSQQKQLIQKKENKTGLPDNLKLGIENLSGYSMDDVNVHYNSSKPAQLQAHAYAQGTDIHIAPGQEKHLPHEAWHVVQQKQGRVKPTIQLKGKNINDDKELEKEADLMGLKSISNLAVLNNKQFKKYSLNVDIQPTAQLSVLGKMGTVLGAGIATGTAALALPALFGVGTLASATTGLASYITHKLFWGGPFIGGKNNIDILQSGKGEQHTIGIGYTSKNHLFSHVVLSIDDVAYEQVTSGSVDTKDLSKTLVKDLDTEDAETEFVTFEDFDPERGRLVTINVPEDVHNLVLNATRQRMQAQLGQYGILSNSCASNIASILKSAGLNPPSTYVTPTQLWTWMHGLHQIQTKLA